ncbi:hypothetical protein [Cupriavidus sp. DF5525]|uniref:hypothetical protein n=1 Tax=Cupriavidus sp. DF5525 TaxID=3160989 RepID=UPI0032DF5628
MGADRDLIGETMLANLFSKSAPKLVKVKAQFVWGPDSKTKGAPQLRLVKGMQTLLFHLSPDQTRPLALKGYQLHARSSGV